MTDPLLALIGQVQNHGVPDLPDAVECAKHSYATETNFVPQILPAEPYTLRPYQLAAVEHVLRFRRGFLGQEPGLGKSIMALTAMVNIAKRPIIIHPPSVLYTWKGELEKFFPNLTVHFVQGRKREAIPEADVILVPDSVLSYRVDDLISWQPDFVAIDEAQRFKNEGAGRTQAAFKLQQYLESVDGIILPMSGTPARNEVTELWALMKVWGYLDYINYGNQRKDSWIKRWTHYETVVNEFPIKGEFNDDGSQKYRTVYTTVPGEPKDTLNLHQRMREAGLIRVERKDVLKDLPAKVHLERFVKPDPALLEEYRYIENNFAEWYDEKKGEGSAAKLEEETLAMLLTGELARRSGMAKLNSSIEYILSLLDEVEKVVVMAENQAVTKGLHEGLQAAGIESVIYTGMQSQKQKANAMDSFRDGSARVLVGNNTAAGVGLNMQIAHNLVFVQLPWSPSDFTQSSDRIYRMDQTNRCVIHILLCEHTFDETMAQVVARKAAETTAVNAGINVQSDRKQSIASIYNEITRRTSRV